MSSSPSGTALISLESNNFRCALGGAPFVFQKQIAIFVVSRALGVSADILIDESVLAFILDWKSGTFHNYCEITNTLVTPYCIVSGVFCPMLNRYECGVCLFAVR